MPFYDKLPTTWQTKLEKPTGITPIIEVIFDPDDRNIVLNETHDIIKMTSILMERELDPDWALVPTFTDVRLIFNDSDRYFDSRNSESPFHSAIGVMYQIHSAGSTQLLIDSDTIEFSPGETLYIEGINPTDSGNPTNSETVTVKSFTNGSSYHIIEITSGLTYPYAEDTLIRTRKVENTSIQIKVKFADETNYVRILTGKLLKLPIVGSGVATLVIVDENKIDLDSKLTGADSASATKLKCFDSDGNLSDSVNVIAGSTTLDRTKIGVLDNAVLGQWNINFIDANQYDLTRPDGVTIRRDKRYGRVGYIGDTADYYGLGFDVNGNYAYTTDISNYEFKVIDHSTKSSPSEVGSLDLTDSFYFPSAVKVSGDYAFVIRAFVSAQPNNRLASIDISTKSAPAVEDEISQADMGVNFRPYACGMDIDGNYAFVGAREGIFIFDISDPTSLALESTLTGDSRIGIPSYVLVDGNYLYTNGDGGLAIVDISAIGSPTFLSSLAISGISGRGIAKSGDYVFITDIGNHAVHVIDVSTPSSPSLTATFTHNEMRYPYGIAVNGNYLYVATTAKTLMIIDVTTKASPTFVEAITGTGSPYYLDGIFNLHHDGTYLYAASQESFSIWLLNPPNSHLKDGLNIEIFPDAFGGSSAAGDSISFITGISHENKNVVQSLYDIETIQLNRDNNLIHCSSYFGNKDIGTLYESASATETSIKVSCDIPSLIKTGETLTITEGATTEDVTVTSGVTENTQYPPYIELDVSALANTYTTAASITWKQRGSLDTDFAFDNEYDYCDSNDYNINLTLDREMTVNQAIELIALHAHGAVVFFDNWGVMKIFNPHRDYGITSYDQIHKDTNLALPEPIQNSDTMINEFFVKGGYDSANQRYTIDKKYPETDDENQAYIMYGFKRSRTIRLPGYFDEDLIESIAEIMYSKFKNGINLIEFNSTLQSIITNMGDHYNIICNEPEINKNVMITGIKAINLFPFEFKFNSIIV